MAATYILLDIEGTVSPIAFVHQVLFPYSRDHLKSYLAEHEDDPVVEQCLAATCATVYTEERRLITPFAAADQLLQWIAADRKHPALKTLQGLIWQEGYASGAFTSELYPDVAPMLRAWHGRGLTLGIYSSGSVQAQKLLFQHTGSGDLTPLLSHYFDTAVGHKRDAAAYTKILAAIERQPAEVLFLSDIGEELQAAAAAGLQTMQLVRPGTAPAAGYSTAADLNAVDKSLKA